MKNRLYFVFDVESIGLHGEGFAVGYVVIDAKGAELDYELFSTLPDSARGHDQDREWVSKNVPLIPINCGGAISLRTHFWKKWLDWKRRGAVMIADCAWPVEARFLNDCVDDDISRTWEGPYPLHDLASMLLASGIDPLTKFERLPSELPEHNPLCDARHSARILTKHEFVLISETPISIGG